MQLYKRAAIWWARGTDTRGARWFASTRIRHEDDPSGRRARQVAKRLESERLLGAGPAPQLPLVEALEGLREHKERMERSESTMEIMRDKGRQLFRMLGGQCDLNAFSLAHAEQYLDARRGDGVSDHTIAKELGTLRAAMRVSKRHGLYLGDVASWWPDALENVYTPRERWLTVPEFEAMLLAAYPPRREHTAAYVYLGVRYSELYRIEARHLDHEARSVRVHGTKTKGAVRDVPASPAIWEILTRRALRYPKGPLFEKWNRHNMRQALHRWCARAGIEPVSANDLRRTFASWLCSAGVPELTCARLLGHASSTMVRRVYAQLSPETLRTAIDRLPTVSLLSQYAGRNHAETATSRNR